MTLTTGEAFAAAWLIFGAGVAVASYLFSAGTEVTPGSLGYPRTWDERFADALGITVRAIGWPITVVWLFRFSCGMSWALMEALRRVRDIETKFNAYQLALVQSRFGRQDGTDGHAQERRDSRVDGNAGGTAGGGDSPRPGAGA